MNIDNDLYEKIQQSIPTPCVDLFVINAVGELLLAKRTNQPAKGQWWFPGGRVHLYETREDAVKRKLLEECGLTSENPVIEIGTFDVFLQGRDHGLESHAITTVYLVRVDQYEQLALDAQHSEAQWRDPSDWLQIGLFDFVRDSISAFMEKDLLLEDK